MVNIDNLKVLGILHELTENLQDGAVPFSQIRKGDCFNKLVYDDSKPVKTDRYTTYPVVFNARLDGERPEILSYYDAMLEGLTVRYCVSESDPVFNCIDLTVKDRAGAAVRFEIEKDWLHDNNDNLHFRCCWPPTAPASAAGSLKARFQALASFFKAKLRQ